MIGFSSLTLFNTFVGRRGCPHDIGDGVMGVQPMVLPKGMILTIQWLGGAKGLGASWGIYISNKNPGAKATNWLSPPHDTVEYCGWKKSCTTLDARVSSLPLEAKCSETFSGGPHQGQPLETLIEVTGLRNLSWEFVVCHSYV